MSSSSNRIDYSLRQNKAIERGIVFDGIRRLIEQLGTHSDAIYVGFGSVWFTDFHLAHRQLGIEDMISLENDDVTAVRAEFNKPYRTIDVRKGDSIDLLPELLQDEAMRGRPWISWLDFDQALDEDRLRQVDDLVRDVPANSFVITTFSATPGQYGKPNQRLTRLADLFGFAMPDLNADDVREEVDLARVLARTLSDRLIALSIDSGREIAIPTFRLQYKDGVTMVTVGVYLPDEASAPVVGELVAAPDWEGVVDEPITTPPLTAREVAALRALLPAAASLTRSDVVGAGFDLEDDQIASFSSHYLRYPTYAQLAI